MSEKNKTLREKAAVTLPGPGSYDAPVVFGSGPKFSMKGRYETKKNIESAPYHNIPSTVGEGPKVSFGQRIEKTISEQTPGPSYVPPPLGQESLKISMGQGRTAVKNYKNDIPGPGSYSIPPTFANEAPTITLHTRIPDNGTETISPGPGAYYPNIDSVKKCAPKSSLHIRPKENEKIVTPGPSDYAINRDLGGKKASFHIRSQTSLSNTVTPGPGQYEPTINKSTPSFTIKSRHETELRPISAPYILLPSTIGTGPKPKLASRHFLKDTKNTPGPNYVPPSLGSEGKKIAFGVKHIQNKGSQHDNPGPGAYDVPPMFSKQSLKSTLHGRTYINNNESISPGPASYMPNIDAVKPKAPASSMHIRPKEKLNTVY